MRCVVHIGTEKTGSTAIQAYLVEHRKELREAGVVCAESFGKGNSRAFAAAFTSPERRDDFVMQHDLDDPQRKARWLEQLTGKFDAEIARAKRKGHTLLISSEHLHSRLLSHAEVQSAADFLLPRFDSVEIYCYLRRQDELALSRFSEALRAGHAPPALLPKGFWFVRNQLAPYFDYTALLDRWASAFGEGAVRPRVFSRDTLFQGDVVADFLHCLGLAKAPESRVDRVNEALPAVVQAALYTLNRQMAEPHAPEARALRKRLVALALDMGISGSSLQPSEAMARDYYQTFVEANSELAQRWFGRDTLFKEDFSRYPAEPTPIASAEVATLLGRLLLQGLSEDGPVPSLAPIKPKKPMPDFNWC